MRVRSKFSAHFGTWQRGARAVARASLLISSAGLLACVAEPSAPEHDAESQDPRDAEQPAPSVDAGREESLLDAEVAAGSDASLDAAAEAGRSDTCSEHAQKIASFVESHRSCSSDDDCVLVGDCSHSNFQGVARSAEAEAKALVFDDTCRSADGPGYFVRCRDNKCVGIRSRVWCGSAPQTECPTAMARYEAGCGGQNPAGFRAGCNTPCNGLGDDGPCTSGYTCQKANINPCPSVPGANTCDACGADKWLCLPAAACQVELSLAFDGRSAVRVLDDEATELKLWLENRTDQTLTFSYELPCNGPTVVGLADYDLWGACLAGACPSPRERVEVTLAPRERRLYRSALVELKPSTCNMHGLAQGRYTPTFGLPYVQGANVCGPSGTLLIAGGATP